MDPTENTLPDKGEGESPPGSPKESSQALQRAPTLIAGRTGGSGGLVQVWSPGNLALLRAAGPPGMIAIPLVLISLLCILPAIFMGQAVGLLFGLVTG
ncbi:MAG: hypothetical protein M3Y56_10900, partial [Armatimonadota bacterium]|nr:hypothetical protein [Armatimonadota bacterium]